MFKNNQGNKVRGYACGVLSLLTLAEVLATPKGRLAPY